MIEEEFRSLVDQKVVAGSSFVKAVYKTMDEAAAEEDQNQWACHKGCSGCCKQMITVTSGEIDEIVKYLNGLRPKKRRRMMNRVWERVEKYFTWHKRMGGPDNPLLQNPMWIHDQWGAKPCPFLSPSGACSIHPVRPMDCRTMYSRSVCYKGDWSSSDVERMISKAEGTANNMVLEYEQETQGIAAVAPIHHWLRTKKHRIKI